VDVHQDRPRQVFKGPNDLDVAYQGSVVNVIVGGNLEVFVDFGQSVRPYWRPRCDQPDRSLLYRKERG
jgi:hypothetical protein